MGNISDRKTVLLSRIREIYRKGARLAYRLTNHREPLQQIATGAWRELRFVGFSRPDRCPFPFICQVFLRITKNGFSTAKSILVLAYFQRKNGEVLGWGSVSFLHHESRSSGRGVESTPLFIQIDQNSFGSCPDIKAKKAIPQERKFWQTPANKRLLYMAKSE